MNLKFLTVLLVVIPAALAAQDSIPQTVDLSKPIHQLTGHNDDVEALAYSPNGKYLATGDWNGQINIYNASSDSLIRTFKAHSQAINCLAFSRDSRFLASGSNDGSAAVWNADTGHLVKKFEGHVKAVKGLTFDRTGASLLTVSLDTTLKIWNIKTASKRSIKTIRPATAVAVSMDGSTIFVANESSVIATFNAAGIPQKTLTGHADIVNALAISPNGQYILSGSNDKTAILWDVKTGKLVRKLNAHTWKVQTVAFSPDNKYILTGSNDGTVKIWNTETGELIRTLSGYGNNFKSVSFSADITKIATASAIKGGKQGAYVWPSGFKKEAPAPKVLPAKGGQASDSTKKTPVVPGGKKPADGKKTPPAPGNAPADTARKSIPAPKPRQN